MSNTFFKIEDLSTAEDIENACAKLSLQEKEIDEKLDAILSRQCFLEAKLSNITKALPNLQIVHSDARQLSEMINFTSTLAENVSAKVRQLDEARSRVSECQQRVHDLLDLQLCSQGVQTALHNEDYEKAAAHVHRFLSMDQLLLKQTADDVSEDGSSVATSLGLLREAATQLRGIVTEKFDEAVRAEDLASVERFFKLFPLLGMHDQGIEKFTDYLCSKLEDTAHKNLRVAQECKETDKRANIIYADTLTLLFEGIARVIEIHQPLIETYYGPGRLLSVARRLQRECDREARWVLTDFGKRRQLTRRVQAVSESLRRPTTAPAAPATADPNALDPLMGEITVMHARADLYLRFLRRRITADAEVAGGDDGVLAEMEALLSGCELSHRMQELLGSYLLLERYYMEQSVRKAVDLDALDDAGLTSSLVDDVFFILRKCIRRCVGAASLDGACAVVNDASSVLETELCVVLRAQLKQGYPSGYLDLTQAYNALHSSIQQGRLQASDSDHAKAMFLAYLNNADVSTEFVTSLRDQLAEEIPATLTWMSANDRAKLDSCLTTLGAATAGLRTVVELGMQQLRSSAVKPRVAQWVDAFQDTSHQLTEEEFVGLEAHLPFVAGLVGSLDSLLAGFKAGLTPANYDTLVGLVAAEVTAHMEKVVFKATFNRMGGLLLDKEVRALVGYLTAATSWSVRDRFARLSQIATVLSLERCAEIADYCGNGGALTWRLTPSEVRRVMGLRTDFRTEDIRRLKL